MLEIMIKLKLKKWECSSKTVSVMRHTVRREMCDFRMRAIENSNRGTSQDFSRNLNVRWQLIFSRNLDLYLYFDAVYK